MMLTTEQLAAALQVSGRQIQRMRGAGMPCIHVGARSVRYNLEDCTAWLQTHGPCLSTAAPMGASKSLSASAASAFTAAARKAQLRVMPSDLSQS